MSPDRGNGSGLPPWSGLSNGNNASGLTLGGGNSNGNGSPKGAGDAPGQSGPGKPPGSPSLYGRLQEGMGYADPRAEALDAVRVRVHRRVITELGPVFYNNLVDQKELRSRVERIVQAALRTEKTPMSAAEAAQVAQSVTDDVLGYGPIERLLNDPTISEIMVNGPDKVYIERNGKIIPTKVSFLDEAHLRHVTGRIVAEVGRHIDESSPMVDARLLDGSRVNAIYPPLAVGGPFLTIRKFATDPYTLQDLIGFGTFTPQVGALLEACVEGRANVLVSGGASTGKTTLLNVLSSFIPTDERIITIEDAKELQLRQRHVVALESRPPNTEGKGEVTIRDLLRNALRMRPDRIIIGECRSGEALDMLQAMNTGHEGSLTTVHANSPRDALVARRDHDVDGRLRPSRSGRTGAAGLRPGPHSPPGPFEGRHPSNHPGDRGRSYGRRGHPPPGHLRFRLPHGDRRRRSFPRPPESDRAPTPFHRKTGRSRRQGRHSHLRARRRTTNGDHWPELVAWPLGLASMTAPAAGWSHTVLVHLHRLRSPLGVALLTAAFCLLLALLLIRQRRRRNLATVRERTAVLRTSPAALRRPQANLAAATERKSITSRVGGVCSPPEATRPERGPGPLPHNVH